MNVTQPLLMKKLCPVDLNFKPCGIVMGRTGSGKTTLLDAICGTVHDTGDSIGSMTRNLIRNDASCGDHTFSLIDTPGTDSSTETYKHAFLLREGLTATKINTIFIIIEFQHRFDKMVEIYFEVEQPVYNYTKKIVVMVSHWDKCENPEKSYTEICRLFQDECPDVANIIFYSKLNSNSEVANLMYQCLSNMQAEDLLISDDEFFLKFNVYQMKTQIKRSFGEYQKKANALEKEYTGIIRTVECDNKDKDEILHMTIVKFKDEMENLLHEFQQQHGGAMVEQDYYVFYIKMQKENVRICDEFVNKVVPLMSYSLFDNEDPRNLIKQCPYCELIWFKTEGCDGATTCGKNGFIEKRPFSIRIPWKYILERINGKLQIIKAPTETNIPKKQRPPQDQASIENDVSEVRNPFSRPMGNIFQRMMSIFGHSPNKNRKGVGCGKKIVWSELPKLDDDLILELFKVKTIDQAKELIKDDHFREVRQNYENNIDSTFHS